MYICRVPLPHGPMGIRAIQVTNQIALFLTLDSKSANLDPSEIPSYIIWYLCQGSLAVCVVFF